MVKQIILPILGVALFIIIVGLYSQGKITIPNTPTPKPSEKSITINNKQIYVEVSDTDSERQKGLSGRTKLNENSGMIFSFDKNSKPIFWMKDTNIPLDIIWILDGKIVGINKNVPTEIGRTDPELTRYSPPTFIDYVLEVNAGFCDRNGITVGQNLSGLEQL